MTESRRLVYDSLEFRHRGRIPRDLWLLPWAELHHKDALSRIRSAFPPDIVSAPEFFTEPPLRTGEPYAAGRYVDEWGCVFDGIEKGIIGEVKEPLFADWDGLDALRIPRERLSVDREAVGRFCSASERFVLAPTGARPFERAQFLRGTENLYMDFYEHPGEVRSLLYSLHRHYLEEMEVWSRTDVDGLFMMDDWGSQGSLLIDPSLWREVFKPLYADYAALAHSAGKKIFMHSDGHILSILEDLIEIGVDALNSQVFCMGLDSLSGFRGRITFWGEVDRQGILPDPDPERSRKAVRELSEALYEGGGVIAQCEFGPGARPENVWNVFDEWDKEGSRIHAD